MNTATIRLQTLCGCTQFMAVPLPVPSIVTMPITAHTDLNGVVSFGVRTFRLVSADGPTANYTEVPEGL